MTAPTREQVAQRFWSKVDKGSYCWDWTAARTSAGYGSFRYEGRMTPAHRVAYQLEVGPIPDGLVLDHLCRNRACVRPEHLEPVTNQENTLRGDTPDLSRQRAENQTHCKHGHEYTPENTYYKPSSPEMGRTHRNCRECSRIRQRNTPKVPCPVCGKLLWLSNLKKHERTHR